MEHNISRGRAPTVLPAFGSDRGVSGSPASRLPVPGKSATGDTSMAIGRAANRLYASSDPSRAPSLYSGISVRSS